MQRDEREGLEQRHDGEALSDQEFDRFVAPAEDAGNSVRANPEVEREDLRRGLDKFVKVI
jgi:hypothetical protein